MAMTTGPVTEDLAARLLAAIEETERIARDAIGDTVFHPGPGWTALPIRGAITGGRTHWVTADGGCIVVDAALQPVAAHIAYNDPAMVLHRCEADRRTVERHRPHPEWGEWEAGVRRMICVTCGKAHPEGGWVDGFWPCPDLLDRAAAYDITTEGTTDA